MMHWCLTALLMLAVFTPVMSASCLRTTELFGHDYVRAADVARLFGMTLSTAGQAGALLSWSGRS